MPNIEHPVRTTTRSDGATPIDMNATLFVALELSLTRWVIVASAPGGVANGSGRNSGWSSETGEDKASKHAVAACDGPALLALLDRLRKRAESRRAGPVAVVAMQEAGRDGFWVHRLLEAHGVHSQVVDPSSIALNRRSRRAKTDRIDAEAMLRTLMAWARGERQVCSMVHPPTRQAEDARRLCCEREALLAERIRHANRIKGGVAEGSGDPQDRWNGHGGLLATQGVFGFEPIWQDRRARLADLRTPEGETLPPRLRAEILRQVARLELTMQHLAAVETERDAALAVDHDLAHATGVAMATAADEKDTSVAILPESEGAGARCCGSRALVPKRLRFSPARRSFATSETAVKSQLTPALPRALGRAAVLTTSKAYRKPAMRACARPWVSSPGCGCATSRTVP
jgi:transposase